MSEQAVRDASRRAGRGRGPRRAGRELALGRAGQELVSGAGLLVAVAVAYLAAQLVLVGTGRSTGFDEAIYLSEASSRVPSISWAPHRALGLVWLLKPALALGAELPAVRAWLAVVSSVGLVLAFWPWTHAVGRTAALGAAVFASCWVSLLYGTEVYPNLPTALGVVAAVGWAVVPRGATRRGMQLLALAAAVAVVTVVRPSDSVWLALLLAGALPATRGRDGIGALAAAAAGAVAGAVPWLVEAVVRFDGPVQRLEDMSGAVLAIDPAQRLLSYLSVALEATSAGPSGGPVDLPVLLGAGVIVALVAIGCLDPGDAAAPVRIAAAGGVLFAAAYVVLTDAVYVRFLLPSWGLVSLAVAAGLRSLAARRRGPMIPVLLAALAVWWLVGQAVTTRVRIADITGRSDQTAELVAAVDDVVAPPCYLFLEGDYPSVGYLSGCQAGWYRPDAEQPFRHDPAGRAAAGYAVYALVREPTGPVASWPATALPDAPGWTLLELPDQS